MYNAPMNPAPTESVASAAVAPSRALTVWLLAGLATIFLWRVLFSHHVNLIPDECSYWAWSRRLDWSYFDNSGMVAYLIRLSTAVLGEQSPFAARLPFLVLSVLTTYLVYRVSVLLFGRRARALLAATLFNLTPAALLGGSAAIHDNALIFFWTLTLWAAAQFIRSGDGRWFFIMGIAAGLSIQSKYTGVLVLLSLFIFLIWNKTYWRLLITREPWFALLLAFLFTIPIIWWNISHDWASLHHVLFIGSGSASVTKRFLDGLGYHAAQFAFISPLFYVALAVACFSALARNVGHPRPEQTLLLSFSLPLALFGIQAFRGHVEANWAFMGYLSAAILSVETVAQAVDTAQKGIWRMFGARYLKWGIVLAVAPVALVVTHAWVGLIPAELERRVAKADRIIWETWGWKDLGLHVEKLVHPDDVIAADSYQLCALLEFNVPGNPRARYLAPWKRPTQFDVWEPSFDNLTARHILFVSPVKLEPSSSGKVTIYESFSRVEALEPYQVMYHGTSIREIFVYRGYGFNPSSPRRLGPRSLFYQDYP